MMSVFFDSNCHTQLIPNWKQKITQFFNRCNASSIEFHISVNGVTPDDWHQVEEIYSLYPRLVHPNFGIHPWHASFAALNNPLWKILLNELLKKYPNAGIGEIGLDKSRKGLEKSALNIQMELLESQMRLAIEYHRPMNIHCVKAHAELLDVLSRLLKQQSHQPGIILHSYAGSVDSRSPSFLLPYFVVLEMVRKFSSLNCFFSYGGPIASASRKVINVLTKVPLNRLLVESDAPDQFPSCSSFNTFLKESVDTSSTTLGTRSQDVKDDDKENASRHRLREVVRQIASEQLLETVKNENQSVVLNDLKLKIENENSIVPFVISFIHQHLKSSSNSNYNCSLDELSQIVFTNGKYIYCRNNKST